jgi:hypothetical protein
VPAQRKGKHPIARSPRKQLDALIVLSCIPHGVQATPSLLGCIERLWYAYHDVFDNNKFPEFAQQVYMESLGMGPLGYPVLHPKHWVAGLVNTRILNLLEIPHFGRGKDVNNYIKQLLADPPWSIFVAR